MSAELNPIIHPPKRLTIMAILTHSQSADFQFLKDHLQVSDSDLSKQMTTLAEAEYVTIHKTGRGRASVTTYAATKEGRNAYASHRKALEALLNGPLPS